MFSLYSYNSSAEKYEFEIALSFNDFIDYNFVKQDYRGVSEFTARLKGSDKKGNVPKYDNLFANKESDIVNLKPLIIARKITNGNEVSIAWFTYILTRLKVENADERYYELIGTDFKFFEQKKLINSNKDYPNGSFDPENIPDDFGKYNSTATLQTHLIHAYKSFLAPNKLTFGRLDNTIVAERKFKGLDDVEINYISTTQKSIQSDITNVFEFKNYLFEAFDISLEVREIFDEVTGKIKISLQEPTNLDMDIIKKNQNILNQEIGSTTRNNFVFGYGNPNVDTNQFNLISTDFTSLEIAEDVSFVSGDTLAYAVNTTKTLLKEEIKNRFIREFQISPVGAFTEINAGDIAEINNNTFKIKSLTETNSVNGLQFFIEIE